MMIERKSTFFLGIFIFIIPFLGFPSLWKEILTIAAAVTLILLSVRLVVPKKPVKHKTPKEKVTPVFVESIPVISPRNDTVEVVSQIPGPMKMDKQIDKAEPAAKPAPKRTRAKKTHGPAI